MEALPHGRRGRGARVGPYGMCASAKRKIMMNDVNFRHSPKIGGKYGEQQREGGALSPKEELYEV